MSGRYAAFGVGLVNSTEGVILELTATSTHRVRIYDWLFGSSHTPEDNAILNEMQRLTTPSTGGAVVPSPLDPADPNLLTGATQNGTTNGVFVTAEVLLMIPTNQRASHRWVAAPDGELIIPAVTSAGICHRSIHSSHNGNMGSTMHFVE